MNTDLSETRLLAALDMPALDFWGEAPVQTTRQPTARTFRLKYFDDGKIGQIFIETGYGKMNNTPPTG